jgi:hypothetical protein
MPTITDGISGNTRTLQTAGPRNTAAADLPARRRKARPDNKSTGSDHGSFWQKLGFGPFGSPALIRNIRINFSFRDTLARVSIS